MWYNERMKKDVISVSESKKTVTITIEEYEALKGLKEEIAKLNQQIQWLTEGIRLSRKKLFGASSEKSSAAEQLSFLFNEAEVYEDQSVKQEEPTEQEETITVAEHKRKRRSGSIEGVLPENVPVNVVEHRLSEEERVCEA